MRFLRLRAELIVIVIMSVLCLIAAGISINISIIMAKRHNQIVKTKNKPLEFKVTEDALQAGAKAVNINKITEQELFFNGEKVSNLKSFYNGNSNYLVPIDIIFDKIGLKFNYYSSDDMLEADINGKKILIKLGKTSFMFADREINLSVAPIAAKGHILVPVDLFSYIDGFNASFYEVKNSVFINYYPDYLDQKNGNIKFLRIIDGIASISDITGKKIIWDRKNIYTQDELFESSFDKSAYILKSRDKVYVLKNMENGEPYKLDASISASLSANGRYLYWNDENNGNLHIYDIQNKKTSILENYHEMLKNAFISSEMLYGFILYDYKNQSNYRILDFFNPNLDINYTFIERNGTASFSNYVQHSPDRKKILYYKDGKGYFVANADGTNTSFLSDGTNAKWVSNNKVCIFTAQGFSLFESTGKLKASNDTDWNFAGLASDGGILFTNGRTLYYESQGMEKKVMDLPWNCDYIWSSGAEGPYIVVSSKQDGVFYLTGNEIIRLGRSSLFLKKLKGGKETIDYSQNISISPDNSKIIVLQKDNGLITLNFMDLTSKKQKRITLNYRIIGMPVTSSINIMWVSNTRLLVYTEQQGWLISFEDEVKIYAWTEGKGSTIQGVLP